MGGSPVYHASSEKRIVPRPSFCEPRGLGRARRESLMHSCHLKEDASKQHLARRDNHPPDIQCIYLNLDWLSQSTCRRLPRTQYRRSASVISRWQYQLVVRRGEQGTVGPYVRE